MATKRKPESSVNNPLTSGKKTRTSPDNDDGFGEDLDANETYGDLLGSDSSNYVHRQSRSRGRSQTVIGGSSKQQEVAGEARETQANTTGLSNYVEISRVALGRPYRYEDRKKMPRFRSALNASPLQQVLEARADGEDAAAMTAYGPATIDNVNDIGTDLAQLGHKFTIIGEANSRLKAEVDFLKEQVASSGAARLESENAELQTKCAALQKEVDNLNAREKARKARLANMAEMMQKLD